MKHFTLITASCLAITVSAVAAQTREEIARPPHTRLLLSQTPTPEEVVRQTYAKAMFSHEVRLLEANARPGATATGVDALDQILNDNKLTFTLSDFKAGEIRGNNDPLSSIATNPAGKPVLDMALTHYRYTQQAPDPEGEVVGHSLEVKWSEGQDDPTSGWDSPILTLADDGWAKYLTFRVTATFQGRSADYQAYFVFNENGDAEARDPFIQNSGLSELITTSVYPTILLRTPYRDNPSVLTWLKANQLSAASCEPAAPCCDTTAMKCGVLPSDLKTELSTKPREIGTENLCGPDCDLQTHCSDFNDTFNGAGRIPGAPFIDRQDHINGNHNVDDTWSATCTYSQRGPRDGTGKYPCWAILSIQMGGDSHESGYRWVYYHNKSFNTQNAGGGGQNPSGTAVAAGAIKACLLPGCGTISITFNGLGVSYSPQPYWSHQDNWSWSCPFMHSDYPSPIVFDLSGHNFADAFTSLQDGVEFDFHGDGKPIKMPWTAAGADVGFLVLDRNGDGKINGRELFGNITQQPPPSYPTSPIHQFEPNGFNALKPFDTNGNGRIDPGDDEWSKLRVWVDTCHCGAAELGKLYTLDELGVEAISLDYVRDNRKDKYGNEMRFRGTAVMKPASPTVASIYDVFFAAH